MSAAKEQVATRLLPADRARVRALVSGMPEALRGREEPTEADALRLCVLRGLAWVEAHGYDAEVPAALEERARKAEHKLRAKALGRTGR